MMTITVPTSQDIKFALQSSEADIRHYRRKEEEDVGVA
jgi:hypothetical protein